MDLIWYISIAAFVAYGIYRLLRNSDEFSDTLKKIGAFASASRSGRAIVIAACALCVWLVLESVILSGSRIYQGPFVLGKPFPFEVESSNERYVFTLGRGSGRRQGRPGGSSRVRLRYEISAPNGQIVFDREDVVARKIRRFFYTPVASGEYTLKVDHATLNSAKRITRLQLNRNDNSLILSRVGHLWPIEIGIWSPFYPRQQIPGHTEDGGKWPNIQ